MTLSKFYTDKIWIKPVSNLDNIDIEGWTNYFFQKIFSRLFQKFILSIFILRFCKNQDKKWLLSKKIWIKLISCSWHQFTNSNFTKPLICFSKIWRYDYFNDTVKCVLKPPQDLKKVGRFQSRKNKVNKYFNNKIVDWWIEQEIR